MAWKAAARAATGGLSPAARRVRREDQGRAYRAATALLRRAARMPPEAYAGALAYLAETLDWLNLWDANAAGEPDEVRPEAEANRLFPEP